MCLVTTQTRRVRPQPPQPPPQPVVRVEPPLPQQLQLPEDAAALQQPLLPPLQVRDRVTPETATNFLRAMFTV